MELQRVIACSCGRRRWNRFRRWRRRPWSTPRSDLPSTLPAVLLMAIRNRKSTGLSKLACISYQENTYTVQPYLARVRLSLIIKVSTKPPRQLFIFDSFYFANFQILFLHILHILLKYAKKSIGISELCLLGGRHSKVSINFQKFLENIPKFVGVWRKIILSREKFGRCMCKISSRLDKFNG